METGMNREMAAENTAAEEDQPDRDRLSLEHTGDDYGKYLNAVVPPVFLNSLHLYDTFEDYCNVDVFREDSFVYGRDSNPTVTILEKKIAAIEHASRAVCFASGMAAFSAAVMTTCRAGSHIICMKDVYMPVKRYLQQICVEKLGMRVSFVSGNDLQEIEDAACGQTSLMILESPATFVFRVVDLRAIAEIAHRKHFYTYIDNTCLTPIFQKPLDLGIDITMHTMSKYFGGHSDIIGGVLAGKDEALMRRIMSQARELYGGILGPMEAWLTIRGLRTLDVRMHEFQRIGMAVAGYLEQNDRVAKVYYTGLASHPQAEIIRKQQSGHSSLMSFSLDTKDPETAVRLIDHLHLFGKGCSWGGFESLALCPLYKESQEACDLIGMDRSLIRIYCGLEGSDNLIADLDQALKQL